MSSENEMRKKILTAAVQVFMRYGVARTRMNDIAQQAGIVRQTLYTVYRNKDEVLSAAIHYYSDLALMAVRTDWQAGNTLGDKLDAYFEHAILASFAMVNASPDARDMTGGYNAAGRAAIEETMKAKKKALAGMLVPYCDAVAGLSREELAAYIARASIGLRDQAVDEKQLRGWLAILRRSVLSLVR